MVFGVGLDHFFVESEERPLVVVNRKKDRLRLPNRAGEEAPPYFFESLNSQRPIARSISTTLSFPSCRSHLTRMSMAAQSSFTCFKTG